MDCITPYCRNQAAMKKDGKPMKGGRCHTCDKKRYKKKHPWKYYFDHHVQNAKKRCIPWKLSLDYFIKLFEEAGVEHEKLGGKACTYSIDRIDNNKGYVKGNVEVIPLTMNVQKWHEEDKFHITFEWRKRWAERNDEPVENCPF